MWFSDYFNWWYQNGENQEGKGNNIGKKVMIVDQNELEKKINGLSHVKSGEKNTLKTDQEKSEFHRVFESRKKRQEKTGEKLMVLDDWSVKYLNSNN